MNRIPRFVWIIVWTVAVLILLVVLKVNIHLGSDGFGITQGLVH